MDPERSHDAKKAALAIGGLEHDHEQGEIGTVLGGHVLNEGALFALGAGRGLAAQLPVVERAFDDALRASGRSRDSERQGDRRSRDRCAEPDRTLPACREFT
jgi:hypothetical protein